MLSSLIYVQIIFSLVKVAERAISDKAQFTRFIILYVICLLVVLVIFHFGSDVRNLVVIVPVPGHCLSLSLNFSSVCKNRPNFIMNRITPKHRPLKISRKMSNLEK